jgi:pimeloyl-ACP methyl ester carboxylesterase
MNLDTDDEGLRPPEEERRALQARLSEIAEKNLMLQALETAIEAQPSAPCRPVAPLLAPAAAVVRDGRLVWSNALWREIADGAPIEPWKAPMAGQGARGVRYRLGCDDKGESLVFAEARAEVARLWPELGADPEAQGRLESPDALGLMAFAPSRTLAYRATLAGLFGLSEPLAETLALLLRGFEVEEAAEQLGVSLPAARKRIRRLFDALGARKLSELVSRAIRPSTDECVSEWARREGLRRALGLTTAERQTAIALMGGAALPEIAARRSVTQSTAKSQVRQVTDKCGLVRMRAMARFGVETATLVAVAEAEEVTLTGREDMLAVTRLAAVEDRRQIAFADYGPGEGAPLMVLHGGMGSRRVAPKLRAALIAQGFRVIGAERPGFGLTDPCEGRDLFDQAADDMAVVLDRLGLERAHLVGIDGAVPAAFAFARRHPDRMAACALVSPRQPGLEREGSRPIDGWVRMIVRHPEVTGQLFDFARRMAGASGARKVLQLVWGGSPEDEALLADEAWVKGAVAEYLTFAARSILGLVTEQKAYQAWRPEPLDGRSFTLIGADADPFWPLDPDTGWTELPGARRVVLQGAGRYIIETRAEEIAGHVRHAADVWRPRA